jgi:hypothetical protein
MYFYSALVKQNFDNTSKCRRLHKLILYHWVDVVLCSKQVPIIRSPALLDNMF